MLKKVDGKFDVILLPRSKLPLHVTVGLEHSQWTGGLELWLEPEFCVGGGVGHIDAQAAILTENDECGATQGLGHGRRG